MKKNMSNTDRIIRVILAAIIAILFLTQTITGTFGIVLVMIAAILLLTGFVSFCPLYAIFGIKTCKN